jgi:hypothetical protein
MTVKVWDANISTCMVTLKGNTDGLIFLCHSVTARLMSGSQIGAHTQSHIVSFGNILRFWDCSLYFNCSATAFGMILTIIIDMEIHCS